MWTETSLGKIISFYTSHKSTLPRKCWHLPSFEWERKNIRVVMLNYNYGGTSRFFFFTSLATVATCYKYWHFSKSNHTGCRSLTGSALGEAGIRTQAHHYGYGLWQQQTDVEAQFEREEHRYRVEPTVKTTVRRVKWFTENILGIEIKRKKVSYVFTKINYVHCIAFFFLLI